MEFTGKSALIFAATGAVSGAVALRLAAGGASLYLSARDPERLRKFASELRGARVETGVVDATDERQVAEYVNRVAQKAGRIDAVFNGIGPRAAEAAYGTPAAALPYEKFSLALHVIAGSQFLTARAAAALMSKQGAGAVVLMSASLTGLWIPLMAGITAACGAVETLTTALAAEFSPAGVRVNCVRANGMPETRTIQETNARMRVAMGIPEGAAAGPPFSRPALRRPVTLEETADAVAFLAGDASRGMTGQVVNVCAGELIAR